MHAIRPRDRSCSDAPFRPARVRVVAMALPLLALMLAMLESAFVAAAGGLARLAGGG